MKKDEYEWLKSLDPEMLDGTITQFLLMSDVEKVEFRYVLKTLVKSLYEEKLALQRENKRYAGVLKKHGLYTVENVLGVEV